MTQHKKCLRCGKALTNPKSQIIGYGKVCLKKIKEENRFISQNERIEKLEHLIKELQQKLLSSLNPLNYSNTEKVNFTNNNSKIPLMIGGWDISELQQNELFMKMKALSN